MAPSGPSPAAPQTSHAERDQLVAVEIAEVATVETAVAARPRCTFVLRTELHRLRVDFLDRVGGADVQRDHYAVADRGLVAVVRLRHRQHRLTGLRTPTDHPIALHE